MKAYRCMAYVHCLKKYSVLFLEELDWQYTPLHKLNQLQFTISMSFQCNTDENILRIYSLQRFSFLVIFPQPGPSGRYALIFRVL